jgi:hypothetical protein
MPGGARMPLDPDPEPEPAAGMVAYFQGRGRMVDDLKEARRWAERGATFHVAHFNSCSGASRHRGVPRAQEALW